MVVSIKTEKLVDVVIPNYNRSLVLEDAIASVSRNICINKIWLIDDGSDIEITNFYKTIELSNLEIIQHSRVSDPGYLRRIAIQKSNAEWIAFLDSDDSWLDNKISLQLELAAEKEIGFVCSQAVDQTFGKNLINENRVVRSNAVSLLSSNFIITSSVLVKRELLLKIDAFCFGNKYKKCEDLGTWMRLSHYTDFGITKEPLVRYNISQDSFGSALAENFRSNLLRAHLGWLFSNEKMELTSKARKVIFIVYAETVRVTIFKFRRLRLRSRFRWLMVLVGSNHDKD
jgi:glycosyltransferase involved in cell wall biosynthesis